MNFPMEKIVAHASEGAYKLDAGVPLRSFMLSSNSTTANWDTFK